VTLIPGYRFRWVYCQLETLRRSFPGSIRRALNELPRTLDETYERILLRIDEEKWEYAVRLFRCLAVARRPLRACELAEVLAVDLGPGGMPKLNAELRPRDADEAVLSACSTLVATIGPNTPYLPHDSDTKDSCLVQFSHYSVKEFLTSDRLQSSRMQRISRFHIAPMPAHTILVQSCISTLLQLDDSVNRNDLRGFPLADYAVRNWVEHAQVEGVAPQIRIGMACLFDPELPHFTVWVDFRRDHWNLSHRRKSIPLSYASFYGFDGVVKYLVTTRHQVLDDIDPDRSTPLIAAQSEGHFGIAQFLLEHGACVDGQDNPGWTPLYCASRRG
jgi:ankyrin repeat domain-containing protein 50